MSLEDFDRFFTPMKETKLTKRIFAGFVAFIVILLISCGDLQVFSDNTYFLISNPMTSYYMYGSLSYYDYSDDEWVSGIGWTINPSSSAGPSNFDPNGSALFMVSCSTSRPGSSYQFAKLSYNGVELSITSSSPTVISPGVTLNFLSYSSTRINYYISIPDLASTPTPAPTPTPTPVPTPTPEPTFNPDQPTYTTFFNHLLNDGNNALNALYLSWTQANNKFYTGIFFIGLPIMIGIFGIVASIFFGGDD